jgi:hypothetical protein
MSDGVSCKGSSSTHHLALRVNKTTEPQLINKSAVEADRAPIRLNVKFAAEQSFGCEWGRDTLVIEYVRRNEVLNVELVCHIPLPTPYVWTDARIW